MLFMNDASKYPKDATGSGGRLVKWDELIERMSTKHLNERQLFKGSYDEYEKNLKVHCDENGTNLVEEIDGTGFCDY